MSGPGQQPRSRRRRILSLGIRIAVAGTALVWVFWYKDWAKLKDSSSRVTLSHLALALGIFLVCQGMMAVRWWLLVRALSIRTLGLWAAIRLLFLGLFYNNIMPSSIGGDLLRAWYVAKHTDRKVEAALSVFADRAIGLLGTLCMAAATYALFVSDIDWDRTLTGPGAGSWFGVYALAGLALALAVLVLNSGLRRRYLGGLGQVGTRLLGAVARVKESTWVYLRTPWVLVEAMAMTIILQSLTILGFWLIGQDLGIQAGLGCYFFIFPATWVIGALPISIAGIGVLEGGITQLFISLAGAQAEQALVLALCQRLVWVLASLPGVIVHLTGGHLPDEVGN